MGGCWHWFAIPTFFCGVIIGLDLIDWLRGRLDVFDPVGLVGVMGFHWFFLAPLLQVDSNYTLLVDSVRLADPREWLGWIGVLNLTGLIMYRYLRNLMTGPICGSYSQGLDHRSIPVSCPATDISVGSPRVANLHVCCQRRNPWIHACLFCRAHGYQCNCLANDVRRMLPGAVDDRVCARCPASAGAKFMDVH